MADKAKDRVAWSQSYRSPPVKSANRKRNHRMIIQWGEGKRKFRQIREQRCARKCDL